MVHRSGMTLAQLEFFVAVVETGSISAAAQATHTSQSNVSVAIGKLERHLGVELLVRHPARGVSPTPVGLDLAARARAVLGQVRDIEDSSTASATHLSGEVALGSFVPLTPFYVPALLRDLRDTAPGVTVTVHEATLDVLHSRVADAELDLAVVYGQSVPPNLLFTHLADVTPHVIVAADSPWASRDRVALAELTDTTMVTLDLPFTLHRGRAVFDALGLPRPPELPATTVETMRALVAAGLGFAMLNQRVATNSTVDGRTVVPLPIEEEVPPISLGTIRRPTTRSARVDAVAGLLARRAHERHGPP